MRMKRKVTFRRYDKVNAENPNNIDPETQLPYRGDFIASFRVLIEGDTLLEISAKADTLASERSLRNDEDVRVWEIPIFTVE